MKAVKQNKVYLVDEKTMESYAASGFDIYNDAGEIVMHGAGKTVPYGDYEAVKKEKMELEKQIEALSDQILSLEKKMNADKKISEKEASKGSLSKKVGE